MRWLAALTCATVLFAMGPIGSLSANEVLECDFRAFKKAIQSPGPALVAQIPASMTPIPLNAVQITDKAIAKKIVVQALFARRTPTQSVEVMVRIVNCTDYPLQIEGRSWFSDKNHMPVEDESAWQRMFLNPHSVGVYREISISTGEVANYLVELREGR